MLTKLEIYEKAKSAYVMDYNYQIDKVTEFIKKAKKSQNEKEHWQKYVDVFQTEANKTYEKIREIIDLISKEKETGMPDRKKVIKGLECCTFILGKRKCSECPYQPDNGCYQLQDDFHAMLKEQEVRELTIDEWREWKNNPKRNPICELWENDTSPMWILNPKDVHEPALLMGKLKLFTGKPTFEQCKEVKWE